MFKTKKEKDLALLRPILDKVNSYSDMAKNLKDEDFIPMTNSFKEKIKNGESLDSILPEAFAVAREASFRVLHERHYDVQIMGAVVLHMGKILEMKTGEGKTLTCVPAAYLNALTGKGVHVVTVNDYLAKRDSEWMGPVFNFLGLTVGVITSDMDLERRKENYDCDITYGTNNEFGFDYLRDNMKYNAKDKIQSNHNYCIIDEIDSILIDEARTPLIISGQADDDSFYAVNAEKIVPYFKECEKDPQTGDYPVFSAFARFEDGAKTEPDGDFMINEKNRQITFTKAGMIHMEELLKRFAIINSSLYDNENFEYVHYVTQAMCAKYLYKKDVDYVVQDNEIQIVDEFTGRILYGRRYSNGLHQAIEAKEHIEIKGRNRTFATITFQNFFRMYSKISGMTGTADTEATEFQEIYKLDVVVIPTNLPVARKDLTDLVYINEKYKFNAVCEEIKRVHETGQPILVGTVSIEKSELLSSLLRRMGIKHEVLNAKNHAREAAIIENAGALGAVTIATNMAGRGTDIKLGGSPDAMARRICSSQASEEEFLAAKEKIMPQWKEQYEKVKQLGGLYILGTERHESRRIDNQLRGRSGRQGDPGTSRFYVSFEDDLMRIFAKDNVRNIIGSLGMNSGEPLDSPVVSRVIEKAQKRVEENNFEIRKHLLEYDDVLNEQRNFIYSQRNDILNDENPVERLRKAIADCVLDCVEAGRENLHEELFGKLGINYNAAEEDAGLSNEQLAEKISKATIEQFNEKIKPVPLFLINDFIKHNYLHYIDACWQDHLDELESLREAVMLRTYAQKNPLTEYKLSAFEIFDTMIDIIKQNVVRALVSVKIDTEPRPASREKRKEIKPVATAPVQVVRSKAKVGRNDPCPCGSGKKYKNCCGRNQGSQS